MNCTAVLGGDACERVAFLNNREEAVGLFLVNLTVCRFNLGVGRRGLTGGGVSFCYRECYICFNYTEYRKSHNFLVLEAGDFLISIVRSVNLTGQGQRLGSDVLKTDECARTVGDECVAAVIARTGSKPRQGSDRVELERALVETDTVRGETNVERAIFIERVFERKSEQNRCFILSFILCHRMVLFEGFIRIFRAVLLDVAFDFVKLTVGRIRVEDVDRHFVCYGEGRLQLTLCTLCQARIERVLKLIESVHFVERLTFGDIRKNQGFETSFFNLFRNELTGLFTTHSIFDTNAVFNLLNDDLTSLAGFHKAVKLELRVVVGILDLYLREKLLFD